MWERTLYVKKKKYIDKYFPIQTKEGPIVEVILHKYIELPRLLSAIVRACYFNIIRLSQRSDRTIEWASLGPRAIYLNPLIRMNGA